MDFCIPVTSASTVTECSADFTASVVPLVFITVGVLTSLWKWRKLRKDNSRKRLWVRYPGHTIRWIVTMTLIFFQIMELSEGIISGVDSDKIDYPQVYIPSLLSILGSVLTLVFYDFCESFNVSKLLPLLFGYWTSISIVKSVKLTALHQEGFSTDRARVVLTWITAFFTVVLVLVDLYTLVYQKSRKFVPAEDLDDLTYVHPYANFLSRSMWSWLTPILGLGFKKTLQIPDLGKIPQTEHSKPNFDILHRVFTEEKERGKANDHKISLWRCYWRAYWPMLLLGGAYRLFGNICMYVGPMLIDDVVKYVQMQLERNITLPQDKNFQPVNTEDFFSNGYVLALIVMASMVLYGSFNQNMFYLSVKQGIRIKAALQAMVYEKTLKLPSWVLNDGGMSTGQVMNHMNVDPLNICIFFYMCHLTWSIVFEVISTYVLLYLKLGKSAVISASIMVVMFPLQYLMSERLGKAHERALGKADQRIKKCNEVLQSVKLIKLYAWEGMFNKSIHTTRAEEIKQLLRGAICRIFAMFITDGAPLLALLMTFLLFPHIENKPMEVGNVFAGLALFTILANPLYVITMVIDITVAACVSTKRLVPFLLAPELDDTILRIENGDKTAEDLKSAPDVKIKSYEPLNKGTGADAQPLLLNNPSSDSTRQCTDPQGVDIESQDTEEVSVVEITDGSFSWDLEGTNVILSGINVKVPRGKMTMIVGPVGSGKSSLLYAMVGEMTKISGAVKWTRDVHIAYGAQKAWLLNASLKDNILFGAEQETKRYGTILRACSLEADLAMLPAGDNTEIGEKGINLSGGQKQRVSIARTLYSQADVVILDDPLSALDVHVGAHIYQHAVEDFLLKQDKTVVLVTHQVQYVPHADQIIVMEEGRIKHQGTPDEICRADPEMYSAWSKSAKTHRNAIEKTEHHIAKSASEASHHDRSLSPAVALCGRGSLHSLVIEDDFISTEDKKDRSAEAGRLIEKEEHLSGSVPWRVYLQYCASASAWLSVGTVCSYVARQVVRLFLDLSLAEWSQAAHAHLQQRFNEVQENNTSNNNNTDGIDNSTYDVQYYSTVFAMWSIATLIMGLIAITFLEFMGLTAAKRLHNSMINSILTAPMRFFDKTPLGRIINRISGDIHVIDINIAFALDNFLYCLLWVLTGIILNGITTPFFLLTTIPVLVGFFMVQRFYISSSRELQRLDSITKSPIMSHFSETISGLATIRAFKAAPRFKEKNWQNVDTNNTAFLYLHTAYTWMGVRLDYLSACVVFFAVVCSVTSGLYGHVTPAMVGLSMTYAMNIAWLGQWFMRSMSEMEMYFTSVQRVINMTGVEPEEQHSDTDFEPAADWPNRGQIQFKNVSLRYDEGLDPVVTGINLLIKPGQKVGLCGRTGSGKSSLTLGLFNMIDICQGQIYIDGLDITDLHLHTLRSRLSIIPQDPVLFEGTVRYNLDPEGMKSDEDIWNALEIAQLKPLITELPSQLDSSVTEGGENFSVGQRQLFCLARAVLRHSRILIMDEATASIDMETDHVVQSVIQAAFRDRTVITIAHRIGTILNSDMIVLLRDGQIIEHDTPANLLSYNSAFSTMVHGEKE